MKAIVLMFDSLNRHLLNCYGCDWTHTPNFQRLKERTVKFDTSYVCSMPCMPARRDFHTGRPNFLHRSWGPQEPWDDSVPAMLKQAGIYSHIVTDHQHYWEEGAGGNYLTKYSSHSMVRGQEGDPYYGQSEPVPPPPNAFRRNARDGYMLTADRTNRTLIHSEKDMPIAKTFDEGIDFITRHAEKDNWLLQIETFDPHEPFFTLPEHKKIYSEFYEKSRDILWDWPDYAKVTEDPDEVTLMRHNYASLMSLCDHYLGKLIDLMDNLDLWDDTMLVVWTDHGFCLGEHDSWAKCWLPFYEEIARTPFFIWDPRFRVQNETRHALVQPSIDLGPTLLDFFGLKPTESMLGKILTPVIEDDNDVRECAIFGIFGGQVNITDGRYVYMKGPANRNNQPAFEYTLMPAHMRQSFNVSELQAHTLVEPFSFTKNIKPLKIPTEPAAFSTVDERKLQTTLYDLKEDPKQSRPIHSPEIEARFKELLKIEMIRCDAPKEQFVRLGL